MKMQIKRIFALILVVVLSVSCFTVMSQAADAKAVLTFELSDDGYAVVSDCKTDAKGTVSVPTQATINNKTYKVRYIGDKAFDKCKLITKIQIPEGITTIGRYAFRNCTKLKDVYFPETLVKCEFDAFNGCDGVVIHCYTSTYAYVNICGSNPGVSFDIIDASEEENDTVVEESGFTGVDFIDRFITALKELIQSLLEKFGANDDDFSIEDLPFELPFEIPTENDNPFIDLI